MAPVPGRVKPKSGQTSRSASPALPVLPAQASVTAASSLLAPAWCPSPAFGAASGLKGASLVPARARSHPNIASLVVTDATPAANAVTSASLEEYICKSPLLSSCGYTAADVHKELDQWLTLGQMLAKNLEFDHDNLDDVQKLRIYHYYLPVYFWCNRQLAAHKASGAKHTLVIGISAPQGCGKTTIVEQLEALFNATGRKAASVSIDDFYLTYKDQTALAEANPSNPLLQYRGNAASHDLQLGTTTLQQLRGLTQAGSSAAVPRYDKSAYAGRGDRAPQSSWPVVQGPLEVVLFEGWMSGFAPVEDAQVSQVDPALVAVNQALRAYKAAWDDLVDSWLVIRIGDPQWVFKWRLQAEERMRASGKPGMTDAQIADFVARFMPAYKAYLPGLYSKGPTTAKPGKTLVIEVDAMRSPVPQQPKPVV